jgi:GT2 family glycosyltransferase
VSEREPVWVVVRSWNDAWIVEETLQAIRRQTVPAKILVMDNESSDGSPEIVARYADLLDPVPAGSYVPGKVLNQAMRITHGEFVVFLNSDCPPQNEFWLEELLSTFRDDTGAVFSRQTFRDDCYPIFVRDTEDTFGDGALQARWRHCFSMASSAVRRSVWEKIPFRDDLTYSEDIDWTWRLKQHGYGVRYAPLSIVEHSHNYSIKQFWKRQRGEGQADAQIFEWDDWSGSWLRYSILPCLRQILADWRFVARRGSWSWLWWAPLYRLAQMLGRRQGFETGLKLKFDPASLPPVASPPCLQNGIHDVCLATVGSDAFNRDLAQTVYQIGQRTAEVLEGNLVALILGGGYGRGEGGVVIRDGKECPYNDLDFTLIVKKTPVSREALRRVSHQFEEILGIDVDYSRPLTVSDVKNWPHWLMWHDLLHGHVVAYGEQNILKDLSPPHIWYLPPLVEATRLLLNRGAGLLWSHLILNHGDELPDPDFLPRNYFKAVLAIGDAILLARGVFRTAYSLRADLLQDVLRQEPQLKELMDYELYAKALQFRLLPKENRIEVDSAMLDHMSQRLKRAFLWLETVRTGRFGLTADTYRADPGKREPSQNQPLCWPRNLYHNLKRGKLCLTYPREHLYRELPGLLENPEPHKVRDFLELWHRFN